MKKPHVRPAFLALPVLIAMMFVSCEKEDEEVVREPSVAILSPSDSASVQINTVVTVRVDPEGFDAAPELVLSVDAVTIQKKTMPPYDFLWDTEGWPLGEHIIRIHPNVTAPADYDRISLFLIDTILPPAAPVAIISVFPSSGNTDTLFTFDSGTSYDPDGDADSLLYRWDFDGDGSWDTEFMQEKVFLHRYTHPDVYDIMLEVIDCDGLSSDTLFRLPVAHSGQANACGGYVTVQHGGRVYHTVAIGDQCWLRENMDIGVMIQEGTEPSDNEVIEKYCYEDDSMNCLQYGGLYKWDELMNYLPLSGGRGICPPGWHIPVDEEWKELEAYSDTWYGIGDPVWDENGFRGIDAGKHLKSILGWTGGGYGDNLHDFKALPGGSWRAGSAFSGLGQEARFWTSTHDSGANAFQRLLSGTGEGIHRELHWDEAAFSVRCIKD